MLGVAVVCRLITRKHPIPVEAFTQVQRFDRLTCVAPMPMKKAVPLARNCFYLPENPHQAAFSTQCFKRSLPGWLWRLAALPHIAAGGAKIAAVFVDHGGVAALGAGFAGHGVACCFVLRCVQHPHIAQGVTLFV